MRKVLGASSGQIVMLLCRNVGLLIIVGAVPAVLISYYAMSNWLSRFAYQAETGLLGIAAPYLLAIVAVSAVALLTVISQSYKTAQANPVESLRYE